MVFGSNQTFEPRVGTAQLIFGVIYTLITLIALVLGLYVRESQGSEPWLHYCMAGLFAIMAIKSFIIYSRVKSLLSNGVYYEAEVDSCEPVRGITIIKGTCDVKDYGLIHIESRLVGETVAHEINRFMQDNKQKILPALVVGEQSRKPRGMFTVKCVHGHLLESSVQLKSADKSTTNDNNNEATATAPTNSNSSSSVSSGASQFLADEQAAVQATRDEQSQVDQAKVAEQAESSQPAESNK